MGDSISCEFIALPSLSLGHGNDRLGTIFQYSVRTAGPLLEHSGYILYGHVETSRQPAQLVFDRLEFQVHNKAFAGASATLADVLIFTPLVRFDGVYNPLFRASRKRLVDYRGLARLTKCIYDLPGVAETVKFDHILTHYYDGDWGVPSRRGITPEAPTIDFRIAGNYG